MSTFAEIKRWDRQPLFLRVGFVVENLGTGKTMRVKSITQRGTDKLVDFDDADETRWAESCPVSEHWTQIAPAR